MLVRNTADDDHRMGSEHVGKDVPTKPGEIEYTDRRIFVTGPQVVDLGLVLHRTIDTYSPFQSPLHVTKETTEVKALLLTTREDFLERRKLSVEIEVFVAQICISPAMQLELPAALRCCDVDAGGRQRLQTIVTSAGTDDTGRLLAALESLLDAGKSYAILLFRTIEECTDMTSFSEQ
jgi:hypothetical protein